MLTARNTCANCFCKFLGIWLQKLARERRSIFGRNFSDRHIMSSCWQHSPFVSPASAMPDYESMDWSNPNWATASIAAGAWQSAAPLVIVSGLKSWGRKTPGVNEKGKVWNGDKGHSCGRLLAGSGCCLYTGKLHGSQICEEWDSQAMGLPRHDWLIGWWPDRLIDWLIDEKER